MCRCGGYLAYYDDVRRPEHKPLPVPLLAVHVEATLLDHCVRVEIRQTFANQESTPIEATYQFPLEEANTVCELRAEIDGRKVTGVCKRKEDALNDYDDAIASGHGAYMLTQDDKDMLKLNVGNLPPKAVVVVTVVYVTELNFHNGAAEWRLRSTTRKQKQFFRNQKVTYNIPDFSLKAHLDMSKPIESATSPSHKIAYTAGETANEGTAQLEDVGGKLKQLDKDFVLLVNMAELGGNQLARLEMNDGGKVCAMLAVQPELVWPEGEQLNGEIIVLVDRSASMAGKRIAQVRDSLQLLLRSLPEGVSFNIVGFGSTVDFLFKDGSAPYNPDTFQRATKYIAEMRANLGGTDVLKALEKVAKQPPPPGQLRQILFLTDGEVFNTPQCVAFVLQQSRHTRVFAFGIGSDASEELVRGLAEAGGGTADFITAEQPLMEAKERRCAVMRQVQRMLQPTLTELQLAWPDAVKPETVTPAQLRPLFSGECLTIYAFLAASSKKSSDAEFDAEVTLRGFLGTQPWETKLRLPQKPRKGATLHALAARRLIKELEVADDLVNHEDEIVELSETYSVLSRYTNFIAVEERDEATEGTMQIRNVQASVVAEQSYDAIGDDQLDVPLPSAKYDRPCEAEKSSSSMLMMKSKRKGGMALPRLGLPSFLTPAAPQASSSATLCDAPVQSTPLEALDVGEAAKKSKNKEREQRAITRAENQCKKALEQHVLDKKLAVRQRSSQTPSASSIYAAPPPPVSVVADEAAPMEGVALHISRDKGKERRQASDDEDSEAEENEKAGGATAEPKTEPEAEPEAYAKAEADDVRALPGPPPAEMKALVLSQRYDGSWAAAELAPHLASILSDKEFKETLARVFPDGAGKKRKNTAGGKSPRKAMAATEDIAPADVWATAIALALLQIRYAAQKLNWQLLARKAERWLQREATKNGTTADVLLAEAGKLIKKKKTGDA